MTHLDKFKQKIRKDWKNFCSNFTMDNMPSLRKILTICFLILIFPYLIVLWFLIVFYKYLFIYLFLLLDIIILDFFGNWSIICRVYIGIKKIFFFILYNPFFIYAPAFYKKLRSIFTWKNFSDGLFNVFMKIFIVPIARIFYKIYQFLVWFLTEDLGEVWEKRKSEYKSRRRHKAYALLYQQTQQRAEKVRQIRAKIEIRRQKITRRLNLRTDWYIKQCDLKLWYLSKINIFYRWWYFFIDKTWFIYIFFFRSYLRCKYTWYYRSAYWWIFKKAIMFYYRLGVIIWKINVSYLYVFIRHFFHFKFKLIRLYSEWVWIGLKLVSYNIYIYIRYKIPRFIILGLWWIYKIIKMFFL